ncbi:hypothetical protein [Risungbinella massiliensis]|uniref:hypothetical protein n=1 Tax=Risungbinella massiliensis TaxID=1329796 RepID=UPI0005CBBF6F|nr:hypothetical protein [Risungbinella massiliensis]
MSDEQKKQSNRKNTKQLIMSIVSLVLALPNLLFNYYIAQMLLGVGDPEHYKAATVGFILLPYALTGGLIAIVIGIKTYKYVSSKISLIINVLPLIWLLIGFIFDRWGYCKAELT